MVFLKFGCRYMIYEILYVYKYVGEICIYEFIYGLNLERKYN